ncbi:hypothetical protein PMKS-000526 [Pichia membranifaciens]|uniref:Uncharacterized protein n=1 Tax=Pichia membranifaciens TaxID=4926 RepID=A0A1Q2YC06_9ASCO|nr:hypothetical protein PMKS-000526 [Pichia membranifaciens]
MPDAIEQKESKILAQFAKAVFNVGLLKQLCPDVPEATVDVVKVQDLSDRELDSCLHLLDRNLGKGDVGARTGLCVDSSSRDRQADWAGLHEDCKRVRSQRIVPLRDPGGRILPQQEAGHVCHAPLGTACLDD